MGLFVVLAGFFLALVSVGVFSATGQNLAQAKQKYNPAGSSIDLSVLPPGFDCSQIYEKGIDRQENFRAGLIMIACGLAEGGSASRGNGFSQWVSNLLPAPLFIGGSDSDVILPDAAYPKVTQSESMEWGGPNNTWVVNYNDSRTSGGCYSGLSYSTDNGATWHAGQPLCSGHGTNFGDPIVVYNAHLGMWFAGDLATGCGGQGVGLWTSPNGVTWTAGACAVNLPSNAGDRESMWVDNNPSSPFYGRMYISYNNFSVGGGALQLSYSDNGTAWTGPVTLNGSFIRDIQVTGDLNGSGNVYVATMNEGTNGGLQNRQNVVYRSTNGGVTWASSNAGPAFQGPGRSTSGYFALVFSTIWRHMGWGQPAANGNVVSLDYAACGQNVVCNSATDHGDIYYIRSTDAGVTWSTPVKLNTDAGTAMQWQPSLTATQTGALFASWYDEREVNGGADLNCTVGSPTQNCYRRWGRVSLDNGATWQPDDMVGRALSPLPAQPDSQIQTTYEGDYDYHSSLGATAIGGWTDGRVRINNTSQQDVFVNMVTPGFGVVSSDPACNSIINTQRVDFVMNLTDAVNTSTVQATDFMVNNIPSDLPPTFSNGNATITFHFSSSPVVLGSNTMHIPAGAFNRQSDGMPNVEFLCSFCYAPMQLMVTTTNPPVNGTFSPPAPGDYNYDVNFNQAVDPTSVQDSDLTLTGNVGATVTGHTLMNTNMTIRFMLHINFGGSLTASIAAGAITAAPPQTCNTNAAFSGNYTVLGCPPNQYAITPGTDTIVAGTTDTGNHIDDGDTLISLPFSVQLYGNAYSSVRVNSNGRLDFVCNNEPGGYITACLPPAANLCSYDYTIFALWQDLRTDLGLSGCSGFPGGACGIFTSVSGTMPNRIFNIEWRAVLYGNNASRENFEVRLYENDPNKRFDVIFGALNTTGATQTWVSGVQGNSGGGFYTQDFCGATPPQNVSRAYAIPPCAPMAQDAFSRKVHGAAGTFDIPLPLTGNVGVECRSGGGTNAYQMIIDFPTTVTVESASVTSGTGNVDSLSGSGTSQITVNLSGVTDDGQWLEFPRRRERQWHDQCDGCRTGQIRRRPRTASLIAEQLSAAEKVAR